MSSDVQPRRASTEGVYRLLRNLPWWAVIIAIVGIVVAFSVLTDARYLDAIYFVFDLPWDKELIAEIPIEGETWRYTPDEGVPLRPDDYRFYAEFNEVRAIAKEATVLHAEPAADASRVATLAEGEQVRLARWHIVPRQGLTPEQRWGYVIAGDDREGWAQDKTFGQIELSTVAKSGLYRVLVPDGVLPQPGVPIAQPTDSFVSVQTSTPTLEGPVLGGSLIRLYDDYDAWETIQRMWLAKGVMMTLRATLLGFGLALVLGLVAGLMLVSRNAISLAIAKLYVEVVRGLPLLVIILYAGFVVSPYLREASGGRIDLRGFPGAVIGLGFGYGAYLAEVVRAGIQSVHRGQMEAARSLGMSYFQAMRYVVLPQALRVVLPPLGNDFMAMLKDSSLISVVALPEILQQGRLWVSRTFRAFEGYNTVALFYLVMTLLLSLLVRLIERRTSLPGQSEESK